MNKNIYDDEKFFTKYSQMGRSKNGLAGAGEWPALKALLPDFTEKKVLDLGCGYGWHCIYAAENGAKSVVGVDSSQKMLAKAQELTEFKNVTYLRETIEEANFAPDEFDVVLSSLALHYVADFDQVAKNIHSYLKPKGKFIFSVEHPIFTAGVNQDWSYDENGEIKDFPIDNYFYEGQRSMRFLDSDVSKYHKTLTTYLDGLLKNGFQIDRVVEPTPPKELLELPGMQDEFRRPMMLIISGTNLK